MPNNQKMQKTKKYTKSKKTNNRKKKTQKRQNPIIWILYLTIILLTGIILILIGKIYFHSNDILISSNAETYIEEEILISKDTVNDLPNKHLERSDSQRAETDYVADEEKKKRRVDVPGPHPVYSDMPKVVIVIDDCGHEIDLLYDLIDLNIKTNPAILPHLRFSKRTYDILIEKKINPILHQPMEPINNSNPGEGAIFVGMSKAEIFDILDENIASMGNFPGSNNHMGSYATADYDTMTHVLNYHKDNGMFFLDSRTTHKSLIPKIASGIDLLYFERDLFLDNEKDVNLIIKNIEDLIDLAIERGFAIGIGHLHKTTIKALEYISLNRQEYQVDFIYIEELLEDISFYGDIS